MLTDTEEYTRSPFREGRHTSQGEGGYSGFVRSGHYRCGTASDFTHSQVSPIFPHCAPHIRVVGAPSPRLHIQLSEPRGYTRKSELSNLVSAFQASGQ